MESPEVLLCPGCLGTDRRIARGNYIDMYSELTGVMVRDKDRWHLCWECAAYLSRAFMTRKRFLHAYKLLADYEARCAPFPIDSTDKELLELAAPALSLSRTLSTNERFKKSQSGFLDELTHQPLFWASQEVSGKLELKDEPAECSDFEDHIPLDVYKNEFNCEEVLDLADVEADVKPFFKQEAAEVPIEKKKKKKKEKRSDKKKCKLKESTKVKEETMKRIRRVIEVDPEKIRTITLDPAEQMLAAANNPNLSKFPFRCDLCHRGFNFESKLKNHMKKHSPSRGKLECTVCSMYLPTPYSYRVHELTHTTRYQCLLCNKIMTDKGCIIEHYEMVHEGKVQRITCKLCGKISHNNKTHRGHMRNHHGGDRPTCDECGKSFVNKDSLGEHLLIHKGVKNHQCETCSARFRTKTQLNHHQLKHTDVREFYCVECDVRFKSALNLRQHLNNSVKHRDTESLAFKCPRCPLRLATARALEHHVSFGHDGRRLHACGECGARFATRGSVYKHVKSAHEGYRSPLKHVCDTCGRLFRSKNVLLNHIRTHTGEKPFECGECGRKFSQRTAMRTHLKLVHLKLKRGAKPREVDALKTAALSRSALAAKEEPGYQAWGRSDVYYLADKQHAEALSSG